MPDPGELPQQLMRLARRAGAEIMTAFDSGHYGVEHKDDLSPVTTADIAAHDMIAAALPALLDIPLLSEEGAQLSTAERRRWQRYWLIDPLDGTREFMEGRGEFTVNIALIEAGKPVVGVVYCPPHDRLYLGNQAPAWGAAGAFLQTDNGWQSLTGRVFARGDNLQLVQGRRSRSEAEAQLMAELTVMDETLVAHQLGSSLKLCALAEGRYHIYPRLGPTSEWDTAAGQAVLEAAGGAVLNAHTLEPLTYNARDSLLNPPFWALADWGPESQALWRQLHGRLESL